MIDSALFFAKIAEDTAKRMGNKFILYGISYILGNIYAKRGNDQLALQYYRQTRGGASSVNLAAYYRDRGVIDSAIYYAESAYESSIKNSVKQLELNSALILSSLYELKAPQKALHYLKIAINAKDSLYGAEQVAAVTSITFKEKERKNEIRMAQIAYRSTVKLYALLAGLALVIIIALLLFRNIRSERKANTLLTQQKNEITRTLSDLKTTQAQLIQSEKMASLGVLTAGIAHEIQNPLNFVNNFSEINKELLAEMNTEMDKGNLEEAKAIAKDIIDNEEKINHHGKRADAIVKGMLQHSSSGSGKKEPADINKLADEYLRLAYHGLRAKDKSFNAIMKTNFEEGIGKIHIISQDIGRVILNLITNGFYAVTDKVKQAGVDYEPTVSVITKKIDDKVEIRVADNGNGIPLKILDKIFQPFFTTKPTGQGTGLGLSLSYDIIKAHGGELKVETKEDEGSQFIIILPA